MRDLIIGGTSGLGVELAHQLSAQGHDVIVTGRHNPEVQGIAYKELDLSQKDLPSHVGELVVGQHKINTLIYAAGYYQEGTVTDLSVKEIEEMLSVGARGLVYAVRAILKAQNELDELITITSTSQWTPRAYEPVYNLVKAGAGHFSNGIAEDGRVKKVLVAGPAGMNTSFWDGIKKDGVDEMLDPKWVAGQVLSANEDDFRYKYIRILREPPRVEEVEKR